MDHQIISHVNLRKITVNGKFIIVLTKRSCNVIQMIARLILLAKNGNMMISTVHSRTHQVYCTGIHADIFLVGMFLMDCLGYQAAIRSHHETSQLSVDCHISHSFRNKNFLVNLAHTLSDHTDIIRCLFRTIRNTDTTGKIDKLNVRSCLLLKLNSKLKHYLCKHWVIFVRYSIAGKK